MIKITLSEKLGDIGEAAIWNTGALYVETYTNSEYQWAEEEKIIPNPLQVQ